jgi:Cupin domain
MTSEPLVPRVLLRGEQSDGRVSVTESVMPAGAAGPPLHTHEFDEAFYVLEGELTFQLDDELITAGPAEFRLHTGRRPAHSRQSQRRACALPDHLLAGGLRARVRPTRGGPCRRGAAGLGHAADPRGHDDRSPDRRAALSVCQQAFSRA